MSDVLGRCTVFGEAVFMAFSKWTTFSNTRQTRKVPKVPKVKPSKPTWTTLKGRSEEPLFASRNLADVECKVTDPTNLSKSDKWVARIKHLLQPGCQHVSCAWVPSQPMHLMTSIKVATTDFERSLQTPWDCQNWNKLRSQANSSQQMTWTFKENFQETAHHVGSFEAHRPTHSSHPKPSWIHFCSSIGSCPNGARGLSFTSIRLSQYSQSHTKCSRTARTKTVCKFKLTKSGARPVSRSEL